MASPANDNDNNIADGASDSISSLTPSIPPQRDPNVQSQASDHSAQSEITIWEFYDGEVRGDYDGELDAEGRRCGKGLMVWDNGENYEGWWLADRPHGEGTKTWPQGSQYRGGWKEGLRDGWGDMQYSDGRRYEGGWRGGIQHSKGKWWSADGSVYEGEWEDGRGTKLILLQPSAPPAPRLSPAAEGASDQDPPLPISSLAIPEPRSPQPHKAEIGKKIILGGWFFRGVYVGEMDAEGRRCGIGMVTFLDGTVYEGRWEGDEPKGWGTYQFANGKEYGVEWEDGKLNRQGTRRFANGLYEGEFRDDSAHGQGKLRLADGNAFEGVWKDERLNWRGSQSLPNDQVFAGGFRDGRWHGQGKVHKCEWKDDLPAALTMALSANGKNIVDGASDAKSASAPSTRPPRDPTIRSQASDRSALSKFTIREFYDDVEGWGDYGGDLDAEGRRCGNGLMIWDNEVMYEGRWLAVVWPQGSQYRGGWKEGLRDGWGDMRYADGRRYEGWWRGGIQHWKGKWWSADGSVFEGEEDGRGIRLIRL